ncbi:MFS transporter [Piscirickettsia litoralis]|uniref:Sugar (And other) transporter family protein n=1 Tax=Piscirickettsia litoralis TaxID=1891921 RepID=A0ABX3A229_9GAMM|nr:MFS transporter [Piscirickettsia litoralis]ODN41500.1 sugar (and other) transporter family protein [Piscirickettsia litoralis]
MSLDKHSYKIIILSSIGGSLEFFDFAIYALFAPYISEVFFPNDNKITALLMTFGIFAVGYFARPLGGVVFGFIGDKFGRRYTFSTSIILMACCTLSIGLLPGYSNLGIFAPILLTLLRIIQGVSLGGEIPGSSIFTAEHLFDKNKRGFAIGIIFMCITLGNVFGGLTGTVLTHNFNHNEMVSWGWRIPFIIGFIAGIVSFFLRKNLYETPIYEKLQENNFHSNVKIPLLNLFSKQPLLLLTGFLLTALPAVTVSFILYLPTYINKFVLGNNALHEIYVNTTISFFLLALFSMLFGLISDYIGRKLVMISGCILSILAGGVVFNFITEPSVLITTSLFIVIPITVSLVNGVYAVSLVELFPAHCRNSGMGLSFNLGLALIGGTAPFLFTYLIKLSDSIIAPYFLLSTCAIMSLIGALIWKSRFSL